MATQFMGEEYLTSYHGVPDIETFNSILQEGRLLFPGDRLTGGSAVPHLNRMTESETRGIFTSPTIDYAGFKSYARPILISFIADGRTREYISIVIECKQKKEVFSRLSQTMDYGFLNAEGNRVNVSFSEHYPEIFSRIVENIPDQVEMLDGAPVLEYKVPKPGDGKFPDPNSAVIPVKVYFRYYRENDNKYNARPKCALCNNINKWKFVK